MAVGFGGGATIVTGLVMMRLTAGPDGTNPDTPSVLHGGTAVSAGTDTGADNGAK